MNNRAIFSSILLIITLSKLSFSDDVSSLKLRNGQTMPIVGIGSCCGIVPYVYEMVKTALMTGYRHIDTAYIYKDEIEVGEAINELVAEGKLKREQVFIVTKVWNTFHSRGKATENIQLSLKKLNVTYIDLVLIHWPMGYAEGGVDNPLNTNGEVIASNVDYLETWKALEDAVNDGLVKSIGLSNFNHQQIDRVLENSKIKPAVLQIESHPYLTQKPLIDYCTKNNISVTAYSPLGNGRLLEDQIVMAIGKTHNVSAAQVLIRYQVQRGVSVIPRSTDTNRIAENYDVFNFKLTDAEVKSIDNLNKDQRFNTEDFAINHVYYPFKIPY